MGTSVTDVGTSLGCSPVSHYAERDDLEIFFIEDEIYESEAMVGNGTHRTYVKATAVCDRGSRLLLVVAPELDAAGLPVPAQATPAPPSP